MITYKIITKFILLNVEEDSKLDDLEVTLRAPRITDDVIATVSRLKSPLFKTPKRLLYRELSIKFLTNDILNKYIRA